MASAIAGENVAILVGVGGAGSDPCKDRHWEDEIWKENLALEESGGSTTEL
jgi:hypothetical protein